MTRISEARLRRRVRFYEVDGAGIVHFSWFFRYMEEAEYELWRDAGINLTRMTGMGFPRVASAFEFKRPLRFEDEFEARIQVTSIRQKTIAFSCTLTLDGEIVAQGTMTIACVRATPGEPLRAIPLPAEIVDRIESVPAQA
jgi:YbgC/YbaW family acyl-CoA thioester hydrolase